MKILLAIAITACLGASSYFERADADEQAAHYCEMVGIYRLTHGQSGWPPYLGAQCGGAHE